MDDKINTLILMLGIILLTLVLDQRMQVRQILYEVQDPVAAASNRPQTYKSDVISEGLIGY